MKDRSASPFAIAIAVALSLVTPLTGTWHASGHGHGQDATAANATHCAVDHEAESRERASRATINGAAALHDHACMACRLGRASTTASVRTGGTKPLNLARPAARRKSTRKPKHGIRRQRTARGPPQG